MIVTVEPSTHHSSQAPMADASADAPTRSRSEPAISPPSLPAVELDPTPVRLRVAESRIPAAGLGLFAAESIAEGAAVCDYVGEVLPTREAIKLGDKTYLMRLGPQVYVDARADARVAARYINDARNPSRWNVRFDKRPEERRAVVVATRDIAEGEELYVSYGAWYWLKEAGTRLP